MARRRKQIASPPSRPFFDDLSPHTKQAVGAIVFVVLGLFFLLSSLGIAGVAGEFTHATLLYLFGYGFILAPFLCALFVYAFLRPRDDNHVSLIKFIGATVFFLGALGLLELSIDHGGLLGRASYIPLHALFGNVVTGIVLVALVLVGLFLTFNTNIISLFKREKVEEDEDIEPMVTAPLPDGTPNEETLPEPGANGDGEPERKKKLSSSR